MITDTNKLFIPIDSQAIRDHLKIKDLLPINYLDSYYSHQDIDFGIFGDVLFRVYDQSMIARQVVQEEIYRIHELVQNVNITYNNLTLNYSHICAKRSQTCVVDGDIYLQKTFWQRISDKSIYSYINNGLYIDDDGVPHMLSVIFGHNLIISNETDTMYSNVLRFRFNIRQGTDDEILIGRLWEQAFLEFFHHFKSTIVQCIYSVSTSIDQELNSNIILDTKLVTGTFVLMIIFATILLSWRGPLSTSPAFLGGVGVLATCLGLISGFGFCSLIGIPMCVGIDDMFIIYSAFCQSNCRETTPKRLARTFRACGASITITSLTDILAFLIGFSIAFCYLYQIMLFGSGVALYNRCINANCNTLLFCLKNSPHSLEEKQPPHNKHRRSIKPRNCLPIKDMLMRIVKSFFSPVGRTIVLVVYIVYIVATFYGASQMKNGMKLGQLLADKSYAKTYLDTIDKEFRLYPLVQFIIYKPIPYWRNDYIKRIEMLIDQAKKLNGMDKQLEISWLKLMNINSNDIHKNQTSYIETVRGFTNLLPIFQNDIVMNHTHIVASRFYLQFGRVCYNSSDGQLVNELRSLVKQSQLPIIVYSNLFKFYEQMYEVFPNIVQSFIIAVEAMYIVTLLFIPDLQSVICIISTMIMMLTGLIAILHYWNMTISSVTMVELIMSIGFCADFCVHIVYAFLTSKGTRNQRAIAAISHMGVPIFCASSSTIVGVFFLAFAQSYLFRTFFKTIFVIMCLGTVHALCFLPVFLSFCGPQWQYHELETDDEHDYRIKTVSTSNTDKLPNDHLLTTKQQPSLEGDDELEQEEKT
ncbi:unnamed protein product [Didymodactylos carnosus]|uniref:SSD domain-containing protein n=2 Tax=Didymodactylos carnosus TaxID=1234261 RepID=A0A814MLW6_9BILA|nr:unnamed protein product [Didymodactylos carnosus]CAF3845872.1 unnamed protein product [Didymodactylos carnosus]